MFPNPGFHFGRCGVPSVGPNTVRIIPTFHEGSWGIYIIGNQPNVTTTVCSHRPISGPILSVILKTFDPGTR